ncbi:alpha/beta hydrolase [soil metagenome]
MTTVLTLPGWYGSGPEHWQSHWERLHGAIRVEQADWEHPELSSWIAALDRAVAVQPGRVILVGHSLGCALLAHWAGYAQAAGLASIEAALLVAPPDLERQEAPVELRGFAPLPNRVLPFPSTVVGSTNDPYCSLDRTAQFAADWASDLVSIGAAGHINSESDLGDWPSGWELVQSWL